MASPTFSAPTVFVPPETILLSVAVLSKFHTMLLEIAAFHHHTASGAHVYPEMAYIHQGKRNAAQDIADLFMQVVVAAGRPVQ